jgi:hypothetical protein
MIGHLRLWVSGLLFLLVSSLAQAAFVPINVYPNPAEFGTVPEYSTGYLTLYVSNVTSNSVVITSTSISGTNSSDFALSGSGSNCVGALSPNQTCQMTVLFIPSAIGSRTANLLIAVQGLTQQVTVSLGGTGGNPIPTITSLSPPSAYLNSAGFTLTVHGTGFVSGALVYFSNAALTTTYASSIELTAQVPASDLTGYGSPYVYVTNPGGGTSAAVIFNLIALDPYVSSASPGSVVAGTAPTSIFVNGSNFMNGAAVLWNGKRLPTTYISPEQLQITPSKAELAAAAIVPLSVSNPPPRWSLSDNQLQRDLSRQSYRARSSRQRFGLGSVCPAYLCIVAQQLRVAR